LDTINYEPLWSFDLGDLRIFSKNPFLKSGQTNEKDELCLDSVFTLEAEHITVKTMVCFNVQKKGKILHVLVNNFKGSAQQYIGYMYLREGILRFQRT
jgi:hypothetical protein